MIFEAVPDGVRPALSMLSAAELLMNPKRVASLLRELADAFEEEPKPRNPSKRAIARPDVVTTKEVLNEARRALRERVIEAVTSGAPRERRSRQAVG